MILRLILCAAFAAGPALSQELTLPASARQLSERVSELDSYDLPTGVFANGAVPSKTVEGRVERRTWGIQSGSATTLQILAPLRDQIEAQGYKITMECEAQKCGGFDFRFGTEVVPTPDMYVAIHDYRFLTAERDGTVFSLLISRNPPDGFIQLIRVTPADVKAEPPLVVVEAPSGPEPVLDDLERDGHVILNDLEFQTGSAALGAGPFASLKSLADFLTDNPEMRLALVGHTDDTGALQSNIALSKKRAEAVRDRLISGYSVAGDRIEAQGVGYLAPLTSNLTPEGRDRNRRVEAVLLAN